MHKRAISWIAALSALVLVLYACGDGSTETDEGATTTSEGAATTSATDGDTTDTSPASEEEVEILVWFGREDFVPADQFEKLHAEYPHITVNFDVIPLEESPAQFSRAVGTAGAPDVWQTFSDQVGVIAEQGLLLDMSSWLAEWEAEEPDIVGDITQAGITGGQWNGVQYGISPWFAGQSLIYRADWYEDAGLSHPPETWDDLLDALRAINADDPDRIAYTYPADRGMDPFLYTFGTPFYAMAGTADGGIPQLDSDAGRYWIEFNQTLAREGLIPDDALAWGFDEMRGTWTEGLVGYLWGARSSWANFGAQVGEYAEEWSVAAPPLSRSGESPEGVHVGRGFGMFVNADTEHPEEVGLVLQYLMDEEIGLEVTLRYVHHTRGVVSRAPELTEAQPWLLEDRIQELIAGLAQTPAHVNQAAIGEVLKDLVEDVVRNPDRDPAEVAQEFQALLNEAAGS